MLGRDTESSMLRCRRVKVCLKAVVSIRHREGKKEKEKFDAEN